MIWVLVLAGLVVAMVGVAVICACVLAAGSDKAADRMDVGSDDETPTKAA